MSKKNRKVWLMSDVHAGHEKACTTFVRPDGSPLRDFANAEEMNDYIKKQCIEKIGEDDRLYILGDLAINPKHLNFFDDIPGKVILTPGNHDEKKMQTYVDMFDDVRGYVINTHNNKFIASHIPLHPDCIERFEHNIHGHLHYNVINDPRYLNVSMEQIQYSPISIEDAMARIEENKEHFKQHGKVINFADRKER
jgi:calcineurin-like phosphoesterase family protein